MTYAGYTPKPVDPEPDHVQGAVSAELYDICSTLQLIDSKTFYVCAREFDSEASSEQDIMRRLQTTLYECCHSGKQFRGSSPIPDLHFVERLGAAHRVPFTVETGWRVIEGRQEGYLLEKDKLRVRADKHHLVTHDDVVRCGTLVTLRLPPVRPNLSPGFFSIIGSSGAPTTDELGRFYCNLKSSAVCAFLGEATEALEATGIRYSLKTLNRPEHYGRRDGTVVYANLADKETVRSVLQRVMVGLGDGVNPETPLLAHRLGPGLSFAHDPVQDGPHLVSFGQHRCLVLAKSLWAAFKCGEAALEEVVSRVSEDFRAAGIDPVRPYRNVGR